jgi:hypothetical protein
VKAHGWIFGVEGLANAELAVGEVGGIAEDGESEVPEVDADLVGSACDWGCLEESGSIVEWLENAEVGLCGVSVVEVDGACAEF